jgi:hypothetical protein
VSHVSLSLSTWSDVMEPRQLIGLQYRHEQLNIDGAQIQCTYDLAIFAASQPFTIFGSIAGGVIHIACA